MILFSLLFVKLKTYAQINYYDFLTGWYQINIVQFIRLAIEQEYLLGYCTSFEIGSNLKFYSDQNIVKNFLKELVMYEWIGWYVSFWVGEKSRWWMKSSCRNFYVFSYKYIPFLLIGFQEKERKESISLRVYCQNN